MQLLAARVKGAFSNVTSQKVVEIRLQIAV